MAFSQISSDPHNDSHVKVLVIEDNPDTADSMKTFLELIGHEVALSHTGTEGLRTAIEWHPQIVLCDIGLPEIDGYEVARRLRQEPETAKIKLIAISGYGQPRDRSLAREAGFDRHFLKPVNLDELERELHA